MSSAIVVPNDKPTKEGYLTKQSQWLKEWRKRYFRLIRNKLYFYKNPAEAPHGVIDLKHCLTVKSAEEKTGKQHCFELATPEQVYFMFASSADEKDDWIGKIGKAIVDHSSSHIREASAYEEEDEDDEDDEDE